MGIQEDRYNAMQFNGPEYIPVGVSLLPATWMKYREELDALVARHPVIFGPQKAGDRDYDAVARGTYRQGTHMDVWGCTWTNIVHGMESFVTRHAVPTRADVHRLQMPDEDDGMPHGFMYLRLEYLRGFEEIMVDFAEEPPELQMLIDVVLDYNMRQVEKRISGMVEKGRIVYFGDDLGMQRTLPISPEKWRKYLKPCYEKIYRPFRDAGQYVYMHSDGHMLAIIPDLIECGVNVINPQARANGLDNLAHVCKGKVCVDLDLDRQLFPFCTPEEVDAHILEAVKVLGSPGGGLWLKAECAPDVPLENIEAICTALETYRSYYS